MTTLSILVPCFNAESFLRQCLDSLRRQDLDDCEIICLDDGSSDGTMPILLEYRQTLCNLTILHSQNNTGVFAARDRLFDAASGTYIWFVDSDDVVLNGAVKYLKARIESYTPDIICLDYYRLEADGNGRLQDRLTYCEGYAGRIGLASYIVETPLEAMKVLLDNGGCHLWSKIFKKVLIPSFKDLDHSLSCFEDMPITTAAFSGSKRTLFDRSAILTYRENTFSLSNTMSSDKIFDLLRAIHIASETFRSHGGSRSDLTKFQCDQIGWAAHFQRRLTETRQSDAPALGAHEALQKIKPRLLDVFLYQIKSRSRKYMRHYRRNIRFLETALRP